MSQTTTPKVSIIVPVYNVEDYIHKCLDSISMQTFKDFECILVNDCSPDGCPKICDDYAKQDKRFKTIHKKENRGLPQARKTGVEVSRGNYIQFIDSDDWIESDMIERMYKKATSEDFDIVYCNFVYFDKNGTYSQQPYDARGKDKQEIINDLIDDKIRGMIWFKFFSKKLFSNLVFPVLQFQEDIVIGIQLFLNSDKIGYEHSILYHQRINPQSLTNLKARKKLNGNEAYKNVKFLNSIIAKRNDYKLYKTALMRRLRRTALIKNQPQYIGKIKKTLKALLPYGLIQFYQYCKKAKGSFINKIH